MSSEVNFSLTGLYQLIYNLLSGKYFADGGTLLSLFHSFLIFIRPFSILLTLLFLTGIIYCIIRTGEVLNEIKHGSGHGHGAAHGGGHAHAAPSAAAHHDHSSENKENPRWEKITHHINSTNPSDWRLAILECDIILDEMLTKMGYHGDTLADRLKGVEKSDFLTIDQAWEAHRVRNAIAHDGSNFQITDREAKRVVGLYEMVFKEFKYI
ncbi:MAG: hypothetical protein V4467_02595 [Patescibacteria group bacterium]